MFMKKKSFLVSISILMISQAFFYWFIKLFQPDPSYINFPLDNKIPFLPNFIYIYNLFYPFIFLAFYYLFTKDEKNYYKGIVAGIIGYLICDIIYLYYPTIMPRLPIPSTTNPITSLIVKITYFFDEPALNCFPSIHCLFCFQIIFSYLKTNLVELKKKLPIIIISTLIILSTILVKQHYVLDIISAFLVCITANLITDITPLANKFKNFIKKKFN